MTKLILTIAGLALVFQTATAQSQTESFAQRTKEINLNGMKILGGWSLANIAAGGIGMANSEGSNYYFHEMNLYWNTVNLAIAGLGYLSARKTNVSSQGLTKSLDAHHSVQKSLIFNAGLDLAYITSGVYLMERSRRPDVNQDRMKGYGQSLILQGGFLFLFDAVMFGVHQSNGKKIPSLFQNAEIGMGRISLHIPLSH